MALKTSSPARWTPTSWFLQATLVAAEAGKQRRHLPLRDLVGSAPDVLLALKPCWVTAPLSVPQVLPPDQLFDVVILDEASQLAVAAAVPAVARGLSTLETY